MAQPTPDLGAPFIIKGPRLAASEVGCVAAAYPVWAVVVIALDVVVIYAIVVHGHELQK